MALSQLFWDVLMPWNLKSTYFSLKMIHFLSLNIWYVIYVVFWIKYWNLKLPHHCILFLFTICTVSQLFWNRVCIYTHTYMHTYIYICAIYIVCDNIVIVVLTMCDLTLSSILQKPFKIPLQSTRTLREVQNSVCVHLECVLSLHDSV